MSFEIEVPCNQVWRCFPAHQRLESRKGILDQIDKRRREKRDPYIGRVIERRLLDYELADIDQSMNQFARERRAAK